MELERLREPLDGRSSAVCKQKLPIILSLPLRFLPLTTPLAFFLLILFQTIHFSNITFSQPSPFLAPTLSEILSTLLPLFHVASLPYFLLPPSALLPPSPPYYPHPRLAPTQEGIDIGILHNDIGILLTLLPLLDERGYKLIETYFGARIFPINGVGEWKMEHKWPFVDILYVRVIEGMNRMVVSGCCDCERMVVSSCTKKLCACKKCWWPYEEVFPVATMKIEGVQITMKVMRNSTRLFLGKDVARLFQ